MIESLKLLAILAVIFMAATSLRVFLKKGWSLKAYRDYWLLSEGRSKIIKSHLILFAFLVGTPAILMYANNSHAAGWFDGGSFTAGIQLSGEPSVFCKQQGISGKSNSNFTAEQNVYTWDTPYEISVGIFATHHSCDVNPDARGYDKAGPMFKVTW